MVANALSWKSRGVLASIASREWQMLEVVGQFGLHYRDQAQGFLGTLVAIPSLLRRVIESQGQDIEKASIRDQVRLGTSSEGWAIHTDGGLWYKSRIVVPRLAYMREEILRSSIALVFICI